MVGSGDEFGTISQLDTVSGLAGFPMGTNSSPHVSTVVPVPNGPVNLIAWTKISQDAGGTIARQDLGLAV